MKPLIQLKQTTSVFLIAFGLTCFGLWPAARAVSPPPDGGYPNGNTAEGDFALFSLASGSDNTAIGFAALLSVTDGIENTAVGSKALQNNFGSYNTAVGYEALFSNTNGTVNTAIGTFALYSNTTGTSNTVIGTSALLNNRTGSNNVAIGHYSLNINRKDGNTAIGAEALIDNTTGQNNVALGDQAGSNLTTGSNNIDIGANVNGLAGEANTIRIGKSGTQTKTVIAGIRGATVASGVGVIVGTTGQLGTVVSSDRFKKAIKPMDKASEAILSLQPVTFRYKKALDPQAIPQFGLVAEQVEKIDPRLVAYDEQGKPYSVRYEAVNAMLLNEFLKEHSKSKLKRLLRVYRK
jgi:Chaperone of endosialidase